MALVIKNNSTILKRTIVIAIVAFTILISAGIYLISSKPTNASFGIVDAFSIPMDELGEGREFMSIHISDTGETYASYRNIDDNSLLMYHFDESQELINTITVLPCEVASTNIYSTTGIITNDEGDVYVSLSPTVSDDGAYDESCVRKYTSTGQEVVSFKDATIGAAFYSNIFIEDTGALGVVVRQDLTTEQGSILRFSATSGLSLSSAMDDEQVIARTVNSPVAVYQNKWYVIQPVTDGLFSVNVYDADGVYVRSFSNPDHGIPADGIIVSPEGLLYVSSRSEGVAQFSLDGTYLGNGGSPFNDSGATFNAKSLSPKGKYIVLHNLPYSNTIYGAKLSLSPLYKPVVTIKSINNTSATLSIDTDPLEIADPAGFDLVYLSGDANGGQREGIVPYTGAGMELTLDGLTPDTLNILYTQFRNSAGTAYAMGMMTFTTTGGVPSLISETNLYTDQNNARNILKIEGEGFGTYLAAMNNSKVNLNGIALPFCLDGTGGEYDEYVNAGYPPEVIGRSAPCYYIMQDATLVYGAQSVMVWLPNDFDMDAPGTVSVNGSPAFGFNGGGVTLPTQPTIETDTGAQLTENPTLPSKPIFTGVAEPFATIKVTIHSDPVECTTTAGSDGRWRCEFATAIASGIHTVRVQVTNTDNSVVELGPYSVAVGATQASGGTSTSQLAAGNKGQPNRNYVAYVTDDGVVVGDDMKDDVSLPSSENETSNNNLNEVSPSDTADENDESQNSQNTIWWWVVGSIAAVAALTGVVFGVRKVLK